MAQLFTRRERAVLWILVAFILGLTTLRLLHARQIIDTFRRGEIIRTVATD